MDDTDFDIDLDESENNELIVVGEEFHYIDLINVCRILLRQVRQSNEISSIFLRYKQNYEHLRIMGDKVSNEMYNFITHLIYIHDTHGI